jgi:hypothetical protein
MVIVRGMRPGEESEFEILNLISFGPVENVFVIRVTFPITEGRTVKKLSLDRSFTGCRGGFTKEPLAAGGASFTDCQFNW